MFGYVSVNPQQLTEAERLRFRGFYCGLCHVLRERYGDIGRLTLSHDMTFLSLLLAALYEPAETALDERCALHPLKPHHAILHAGAEYAADMNILLAYYKCEDDAEDEGSLRGKAGRAALRKACGQASARWPAQSEAVRKSLERLTALEKQESGDLDALARLSGQMLGGCFPWKEDVFAPYLREMGEALGRFVYLMDAYEDYDADEKHGRFNPLRGLRAQQDYEARMEDILTMEMAQCARAFDLLPIEQDIALIKNVLYSGVWGRYARLTEKRKEKQA
ncbi:MAG: hypothetical protein IJ157_01875 [Clostridia bacterium]|nr:hypothetical protein [Clostridia bacterium]